ncbi:MAG: hypothetical protein FWB91_11665, partial [Defluviitaleaceae bacterium]|nr:hypothetical protein [Defluviitaleaceae bacterium]
ASTDAWSKNEIRGYHRVDNEQEEVSVKNIYEASQVADIIEENINRKNFELRKNIYSGQDLWENRKELYPRLILCENVKEQIYRKNGKYIKQVMAKLQILNDYFASYDGKYNPNELGLDVSNESESVSQESSLKAMRLFQKPDGEKAYFFEHIKFKSGTRIHYLPCDSLKICYIGYIGIHLRTKLH